MDKDLAGHPIAGGALCVLERHEDVALIWLNNPEKRNALSLNVREPLHDLLASAMADATIRAIVIAGKGSCFCSGGDIAGMTDMHAAKSRERLQRVHRIIKLIHNGQKPVIAAVEGWAIGAGLSIASACDIVVAASDARFSLPFNKVGLIPDLGALYTLPARIGIGRTRWLAMTGRTIDAATAERWGLVEQIAPSGEAVSEALALARHIAKGAPLGHAVTKQILARHSSSLEDLLTIEVEAQALLFTTKDFAEGSQAFLEKREPKFRVE
jgi:2-(1,2-epoxy-1,2-dihydrophenyl)acetyl-CoA isomerase